MKELAEAERRYELDPEFRALVDSIVRRARAGAYTPNEIMHAALAAIRLLDTERSTS